MIIGKCPICGSDMRVDSDMTNADRIRSMSDEELAKWYFEEFFPEAPYCDKPECFADNDCVVCLIDWLKQECAE